jgi:tetratricopeptide (TPR) repeat protein
MRLMITLTLGVALSTAALAQDSAKESKDAAVLEEARQHVARAKVHYDLGEFQQAAEEYIIVYRLRAIPALLFNIAQAYRQGGNYDKAKQFYKAYLRESPNLKNKSTIEQAIREMDDLLANEKRAKERPPTGVAAEPVPAPQKALPLPATPPPPESKPAPEAVAQKPAPKPEAVTPNAQKAPTAVAVATPRPSAPPAAAGAAPPATSRVVESSDPFYKKWWFWTAVGVVVVGGGVIAANSGGNSPPGSHFGTTPVFP